MVKGTGSEVRLSGFKPWFHHSLCSLKELITSLRLGFLIYVHVRVIKGLTSQVCTRLNDLGIPW